MDIDEMSEQEKSVTLLRLIGEPVDCICGNPDCEFGLESQQRTGRDWFLPDIPNLYDPASMALAWRVLNWAFETNIQAGDWKYTNFVSQDFRYYAKMPPVEAQAAWLDKILLLAIDPDLVAIYNKWEKSND